MWKIWLIISLFSFILEIATTGFLIFWFGVAGSIVTVLSLFISNIIVQFTIFIIISTILIIYTKLSFL